MEGAGRRQKEAFSLCYPEKSAILLTVKKPSAMLRNGKEGHPCFLSLLKI